MFLTNNSSKSTTASLEKMHRIGIPAGEDDFMSAADATTIFISENYKNKTFFVLGTQSLCDHLNKNGIRARNDNFNICDGLIVGTDTELTFKKIDHACRLLSTKEDLIYLATNLDFACPTSYGYFPDCGAIVEMLKFATGKEPHFIGKPNPDMINFAMNICGYSKDETVMIGDRLYTDIACGYNAGVDTVLVLTGEGTVDEAAASSTPPTYIMKNVRELFSKI